MVTRKSGGTRHLLIVDDEPEFRAFVSRVARGRGWTVTEAGSGLEMIKVLEGGLVPHGIVLDIVMPDMDGIEAIHRLTELGRRLSVLLVTGKPIMYATIAKQLAERSDLDITGTIQKPLSVGDLEVYLERCEAA